MQLGVYELGQIYEGDSRELSRGIPDNSVDLIFTDPPWSRDAVDLFGWLGQEASRVLKDNGFLFTFVGKSCLDVTMALLSERLKYYWMVVGYQPDSNLIFNPRRVMEKWRPALLYSKVEEPSRNRFIVDLRNEQRDIYYTSRDKRYHKWGQGEGFWAYYLEHMRTEGCVVWDPFCGGGTVPVVGKKLGCAVLGFELDPEVAEKARQRLEETSEPLFTLAPSTEQLDFMGGE